MNWFEICPISISLQNVIKIEWDKTKDDNNAIRIIARLAILLVHLRGNVYVYKSSDLDDIVIPGENANNTNGINYSVRIFLVVDVELFFYAIFIPKLDVN